MSTISTAKTNRRWPRWLTWLFGLLLLAAAAFTVYQSGLLQTWLGGADASAAPGAATGVFSQSASGSSTLAVGSTVTIRTADELGAVSAAGNLDLAARRPVVVLTSGIVQEVLANVGDVVEAGGGLVRLDSSDQQTAVKQALLNLSSAQAAYDELLKPADQAQMAVAEANLKSAREALADVMAGPSDAELAAAYSSITSAQAALSDLEAPPTQDELTQLAANLRSAEVTVAEAQRSYDQVAWRAEVGMTSQAAELQQATISLESAQAAYAEATAPASAADLQSAQSKVTSAQSDLQTLLAQPSASDVAAAEAKVLSAEADLADLVAGADASSLESARVQVEQARIDLESAAIDLERTEIVAPQAGTILSLDTEVGARVSDGATLATIADVSDLELTVSVAEVDVRNVKEGQQATISIDALPSTSFAGTVVRVAPASNADSSVVTYDVTIALEGDDLSQVRPGMTAVADILTADGSLGWLVPTTSLIEGDGVTRVMIVRSTQSIPVEVTVGDSQGEWTVVQSNELQAGDKVVGSLASDLEESESTFGPGGGAPPGGGMMGPP